MVISEVYSFGATLPIFCINKNRLLFFSFGGNVSARPIKRTGNFSYNYAQLYFTV